MRTRIRLIVSSIALVLVASVFTAVPADAAVGGPPKSGTYVSRAAELRWCTNLDLKQCWTTAYGTGVKIGSIPKNSRVTMVCWQDGSSKKVAYTSKRWFYVTSGSWSGFVHSSVVERQTRVPNCSTKPTIMASIYAAHRIGQTTVSKNDRKKIPVAGWNYVWSGWCPQFPRLAWALAGKTVQANSAWTNYVYYKNLGKLKTSTPPPVGALVFYDQKYHPAGHEAFSMGSGWVASTNGDGSSPLANIAAKYTDGVFPNYVGWYRP